MRWVEIDNYHAISVRVTGDQSTTVVESKPLLGRIKTSRSSTPLSLLSPGGSIGMGI